MLRRDVVGSTGRDNSLVIVAQKTISLENSTEQITMDAAKPGLGLAWPQLDLEHYFLGGTVLIVVWVVTASSMPLSPLPLSPGPQEWHPNFVLCARLSRPSSASSPIR